MRLLLKHPAIPGAQVLLLGQIGDDLEVGRSLLIDESGGVENGGNRIGSAAAAEPVERVEPLGAFAGKELERAIGRFRVGSAGGLIGPHRLSHQDKNNDEGDAKSGGTVHGRSLPRPDRRIKALAGAFTGL